MNDPGFPILLVEDNEEDAALLKQAFANNNLQNPIFLAQDGDEAIAYLGGRGDYSDREKFPLPALVLMDLKMPRQGGFNVLEWIKGHPRLKVIPTVILTASAAEADVTRAFHSGASAYFVKPSGFEEINELAGRIAAYWQLSQRPVPQLLSLVHQS